MTQSEWPDVHSPRMRRINAALNQWVNHATGRGPEPDLSALAPDEQADYDEVVIRLSGEVAQLVERLREVPDGSVDHLTIFLDDDEEPT